MGLYLRVGDERVAQWSYSGFNSFRTKLAAQVGINLLEMDRFGGATSWDTVDDPIKPLLLHSDCDGTLEPDVCLPLADRLEEIIKDWPDTIELTIDPAYQSLGYSTVMQLIDHDKSQAKGLIDGMRLAAVTGQPVVFC